MPVAFAWLTDLQDDDPGRTDAVAERRHIRERSPTRIVLDGDTRAFGRLIPFVSVVDLAPPDSWVSKVTGGPRAGSVTAYQLSPRPDGCQLDVRYNLTHEKAWARFVMRAFQFRLRADLEKMWDGFERAMATELGAGRPHASLRSLPAAPSSERPR
ncbi:MAG: hypothetical protein ACYDDF_02860 [Thermoplasmatota archaeon]